MNLPPAAMVVGFSMLGAAAATQAKAAIDPYASMGPYDQTQVDSWLAVHADNTVTLKPGKVELGQGTLTGLLMIAAGYEDGNDATGLRADPIFKMAQDVLPSDRHLASQPTLSRLENMPDARSLVRMGRALVELYCAAFRHAPKQIVLDIDDTFDAVHGEQQLRLFNAHYDEYGFQPMVVFDGEGRFVTAVLRSARTTN